MAATAKTLWLVKSAGQILGPFSERQIADLLRDRVVMPLDEISEPCQRWLAIREVPSFAKIVEEIRVRNVRGLSDDTVTQNDDESTGTETITEGAEIDDMTAEVNIPRPKGIQDIMFQSIDDYTGPQAAVIVSENVFTHENDRFVTAAAKQTSKWVWAMTVVVILATTGFVVFRQFVAQPIQNRAKLDEKMGAGIEALESGDYEQALQYFKEANAIAPDDLSVYLYLGILKIQTEDQAFQGRKLLEKLVGRDDKDMKRVLTGIGLAFLHEGDSVAAEQSFNRALGIDPLFKPALINLGAAALANEEWAKASNHLQLALKEGSADGIEILMLVEALTRLYKEQNDRRHLVEALNYIDSYLEQGRNYGFEIQVARGYIASLVGDKASIYMLVESILDMDSTETEQHRQNLFINRENVGWSLVVQWCLSMTQDLDPKARVIAVEALCLLKARDVVEASRKIDDALAQAPKDPVVLATFAQILIETGAMDRAEVSVDKALEADLDAKLEQPLRLKARLCQIKDNQACQYQHWRTLYSKNPKSLAAIAGLARVNLNKSNVAEAKKHLLRGLQLSANYRPFFPINRAISLTEDRAKARGL